MLITFVVSLSNHECYQLNQRFLKVLASNLNPPFKKSLNKFAPRTLRQDHGESQVQIAVLSDMLEY